MLKPQCPLKPQAPNLPTGRQVLIGHCDLKFDWALVIEIWGLKTFRLININYEGKNK